MGSTLSNSITVRALISSVITDVNVPVDAVDDPIGILSIVPPVNRTLLLSRFAFIYPKSPETVLFAVLKFRMKTNRRSSVLLAF